MELHIKMYLQYALLKWHTNTQLIVFNIDLNHNTIKCNMQLSVWKNYIHFTFKYIQW